ncbi:phosphatidylinositol alpha-1,6-mannosyltransferase [Paenibacillus barengoltzii]|jgi:phosphatidylinositol alpha-1,6-mannosyltransferase|uniref:glycosyltransferase family 4 protein n=1 Tax=Paenibacillus barengoltzii TaxID=343517 RepID=UPI000A08EDEC|nr:glycosyltransferase family 4 protein [Paenibacillus barengoltzii]SMF32043.1 phosphatidylinositol alpha-1,6-mannosyltransferase [Paenibacillus barengoltzii]
MKRKILVITGSFPPDVGGIQNYVYNLCKYSKHDITVLAPQMEDADGFDSEQDLTIIREPFLKGNFITSGMNLLKAVVRLVKENDFDLILCNHVLVATVGRLLSFFTGKPFVIITYGKDTLEFLKNPLLRWVVKTNLKKSKGILTCSEYTKEIVASLHVDSDKIAAILPGVDSKFMRKNKDSRLMQKYNLDDNTTILYTISRLVERKGHDMVIKSLPFIIEKIPNIKYLIIGDGEYRSELEKLVEKLKLQNYVVFAGEAKESELVDHYNIGDIFIMPSRYIENTGSVEGFGIVYLEAAACRKVVIGGNSGGAPEAVGDNSTGILVDPLDTDDIANNVINLLLNKERYNRLASNAEQRAKHQFSHSMVSEQFDKAISTFCN